MGGLTKEYVIRRVFMFFLTVWLGSTLIFIIPRLAPGDPITAMVGHMIAQAGKVENAGQLIEAWRKKFGLDGPLYIQYIKYLWSLLRFDLGYSLAQFPQTVNESLARGVPWTLTLLGIATILSFIFGNTIGALLGWRRSPKTLKTILPITLIFTSIPPFMLGILLIYVFGFGLRWFPFSKGSASGIPIGWSWSFIGSAIYHGILPATTIVATSMGLWALGMRGMMISTDSEDFLILAQAKGLTPFRIFWRYAVRNAVLPQFTALALSLGGIVGGSILVEYIFAYPGMGYRFYQAIVSQDYTMIQGIAYMIILSTSLSVLLIDLLYPIIDPRITYQKK
ncbi:binding-protein-dependent transport systems inner membrane component [Candidatus Moduliflexus flocculans]|uniref:Binding-protein-dependent transport systems inner membrane component n=1 Tax=Candidatus Moduliflexus flocculans TaxID=1499966 RepID=A0A081BRP3_9BACT|nr:binding-protein-dependent transport systems inner membrane component [Candidatus Moduliflexus flocculans]